MSWLLPFQIINLFFGIFIYFIFQFIKEILPLLFLSRLFIFSVRLLFWLAFRTSSSHLFNFIHIKPIICPSYWFLKTLKSIISNHLGLFVWEKKKYCGELQKFWLKKNTLIELKMDKKNEERKKLNIISTQRSRVRDFLSLLSLKPELLNESSYFCSETLLFASCLWFILAF